MQALRDLAAGDDIDIHGLVEKKDLVEKIQCELAKKVGVDVTNVNKHLAEAGAAGGTSLAIGSSDDRGASLIVPGNTNASNLAICPPPGLAGMDRGRHAVDSDAVDYGRTERLLQTLVLEAARIQNSEALRSRLLGVWQCLPDGAGRWCFTQPGADGSHLFYTFMARSNLALAFECARWNQCPVVLDVWIVLCWCPAGYVWPYCMFCHKFCFPYNGPDCHRESKKHLRRVDDWRRGNDMVRISLDRQPRFSFFMP